MYYAKKSHHHKNILPNRATAAVSVRIQGRRKHEMTHFLMDLSMYHILEVLTLKHFLSQMGHGLLGHGQRARIMDGGTFMMCTFATECNVSMCFFEIKHFTLRPPTGVCRELHRLR